MKANFIKVFLLFAVCFNSLSTYSEIKKQTQQKVNNQTAAKITAIRSPPVDSTNYSVQIDGKNNIVKINDKIMTNSPDTTNKKNKIHVSGENNSIIVNQDDKKSELKITQKGENNKAVIIQSK